MCDFRLNGAVVEHVDSYKYLEFVFHATKGLYFGTEALMAVASKALFAMRRRRALLGIQLFNAICFTLWCCPFYAMAVKSEVWMLKVVQQQKLCIRAF